MAKTNMILCSPVQAVKLRYEHTAEELAWAQEMMEIYGCRPINAENTDCVRRFVMDVFHAGRITGLRYERKRRARHG